MTHKPHVYGELDVYASKTYYIFPDYIELYWDNDVVSLTKDEALKLHQVIGQWLNGELANTLHVTGVNH